MTQEDLAKQCMDEALVLLARAEQLQQACFILRGDTSGAFADEPPAKRRGRPKGSKNKGLADAQPAKRRGRPKGPSLVKRLRRSTAQSVARRTSR